MKDFRDIYFNGEKTGYKVNLKGDVLGKRGQPLKYTISGGKKYYSVLLGRELKVLPVSDLQQMVGFKLELSAQKVLDAVDDFVNSFKFYENGVDFTDESLDLMFENIDLLNSLREIILKKLDIQE